MTKAQIEKRKAELAVQFQTAIVNRDQNQRLVDALSGAVQDCDFWLAELAKSDQALTAGNIN